MALFINQCAKRNQIQFAVGRDKQLRRVAEQRANGLYDSFINASSQVAHIASCRFTQGLAESANGNVNRLCITQVFPFNFALLANDVSDVARLAISFDVVEPGIEWTIGSELDQGRL